MKDLRFGLIGCGGLGGIDVTCLSKIDGASFVAYADVREEAAQARLDEFGGDYATADADKLLDDDSIDAIYICTQHDSHASLAIAAAKAGKHIMIEKPLALSI